MKPTEKSKEIDNLLTQINGVSKQTAMNKSICTYCKKKVDLSEFKDALSRKEYQISGWCQKCQDRFFG